MNMLKIFKVGDEIGGYCNGNFGRDCYRDKICVFVTKDYAVFEDVNGRGHVLNYKEGLEEQVGPWVGAYGIEE